MRPYITSSISDVACRLGSSRVSAQAHVVRGDLDLIEMRCRCLRWTLVPSATRLVLVAKLLCWFGSWYPLFVVLPRCIDGLFEINIVAMPALRGLETAGQERTGMKFCVILSRRSLGFSGLWRAKKKQKSTQQQLCGDQPSSSIRSAADGVIALQIAQCLPSSPTRLCFSDDLASFSPPFNHALPDPRFRPLSAS
jgi:hypothetical protein